MVKLDTYVTTLQRTGGVMEEFVNPKYKDELRVDFKKPTRLECMMQDYAKVLPADAEVGFDRRLRTKHGSTLFFLPFGARPLRQAPKLTRENRARPSSGARFQSLR